MNLLKHRPAPAAAQLQPTPTIVHPAHGQTELPDERPIETRHMTQTRTPLRPKRKTELRP